MRSRAAVRLENTGKSVRRQVPALRCLPLSSTGPGTALFPVVAKPASGRYNLGVRAAQYSVVAFPKLDNESELRRLRDRYPSWTMAVEPHIPVVLPFTPLDLDEIQHVADFVSNARRRLHPIAVTFHESVAIGDRIYYNVASGWDELIALHAQIVGSEPMPLLQHGTYEPRLVLGRVTSEPERAAAAGAITALLRTLGLVDTLTIVSVGPDESVERVAGYPFGVGRVDFYKPFPV